MKKIKNAKSFRMEIGYLILMDLEREQELPLPNIKRLSMVIDEYFRREGYIDDIQAQGYRWVPDELYWEDHIQDVSEYMRKYYKIYFGFYREDGQFKGIWKFMNKGEWERTLKRTHQEISTRVENQNEKLEDTKLRWNVNVPKIAEVPKLGYKN
jgi:hypothetical protein